MPSARFVLAPLVAIGLLGAACGGSEMPTLPGQTSGDVNVTGTVDRALAPICPPGEPCDPQIVAAMLVFTNTYGKDVSARVGADGSFALHLDPGDYTIAPAPPLAGAHLNPSRVRVPKTGVVDLNLHFASPA